MIFCKECKQQILNESYIFHETLGVRFCSNKCLMVFAEKEREKDDKNHLWHTIERIFHITKPSSRMLGEIKRFREKENLTYKQIDAIVHYMYEIKEIAPYGDTIYKVVEYKDEAQKWYLTNQARRQGNIQKITVEKTVKPNYEQRKRQAVIINPDEI